MAFVQLPINVTDSDAAVAFHSRLFGAAPAELCPGCANKVPAHDPDGLAWEYYTVLEHIETP